MKNINEYHIHIYYDLNEIHKAEILNEKIKVDLPFLDGIGPLRQGPTGPHPKPMFVAWFKTEFVDTVKKWAHQNCEPLKFSALIHPLTDNDFYDHADEQVYWVGKALTLDTRNFK